MFIPVDYALRVAHTDRADFQHYATETSENGKVNT